MFSCDYNGWADVPEEEREGLDAFEAVGREQRASVYVPRVLLKLQPAHNAAARRAA